MTEPAVVVLAALYELTRGDTSRPVPVSPDLAQSAPLPDLGEILADLGRRGLVRGEAPNLVFLTPSGVRGFFIKRAYEDRRVQGTDERSHRESQDIEIEEPDESGGDDEVEFGEIMDMVRDGARRTRGTSGVRLPPQSNPAPARDRIGRLENELDLLTKEMALSAELSLPQWTQALELRAQISKLLETIGRIVEPRRPR